MVPKEKKFREPKGFKRSPTLFSSENSYFGYSIKKIVIRQIFKNSGILQDSRIFAWKNPLPGELGFFGRKSPLGFDFWYSDLKKIPSKSFLCG